VPIFNQTKDVPGTIINYLWDFGNGQTSTDRIPYFVYSIPGTYLIKLSVGTTQCPLTFVTTQHFVTIEAEQPGITYAVKNTISYFRDSLHARNIGSSVLWRPATSLDNSQIYNPVFYGPTDQLYTIQLRTPNGCLTVDTQLVKIRKNIKIYVPTVFTPGDDGKNDLLRPLLMSFVRVNYFRIYDRWGKLLFEMQSDRPGWDGKFKGQDVSVQTVVWMIEAVDVDGVVHREQGTTVLMR
jgi:gliding motility-associated-like protein